METVNWGDRGIGSVLEEVTFSNLAYEYSDGFVRFPTVYGYVP